MSVDWAHPDNPLYGPNLKYISGTGAIKCHWVGYMLCRSQVTIASTIYGSLSGEHHQQQTNKNGHFVIIMIYTQNPFGYVT